MNADPYNEQRDVQLDEINQPVAGENESARVGPGVIIFSDGDDGCSRSVRGKTKVVTFKTGIAISERRASRRSPRQPGLSPRDLSAGCRDGEPDPRGCDQRA